MGNHTMAINDFNEAIKFDPENSEGYFRRGLSKFPSKRFKEAIHDFE
jgi:tetratricopeptide (TPR) repeat protein